MSTQITEFQKLMQVVNEYASDLQGVASLRNTDLTPDALQRERERMRGEARSKATAAADGIASNLSHSFTNAAARAEPYRPKLNPDDLAQLSRTADAWQFNVLPQLQSGKPWNQIIPTIGVDDAVAIERFAPSYVRSHVKQSMDAPEALALIGQGIWHRHADLATTNDGRDAILAAETAAHEATLAASVATEVRNARNASELTTARITLRGVLAPVSQK